jgi:hypothetical protein
MKFGVGKKTLMLLAGGVWTVAGVNILRIGIICFADSPTMLWLKIIAALAIFSAFYFGIFSRMFHKHTTRIAGKGDNNCPLGFFDTRGWLIMAFMIALGVTVRQLQLLPTGAIAFFYTGLATALIITGVRFLVASRQFSVS